MTQRSADVDTRNVSGFWTLIDRPGSVNVIVIILNRTQSLLLTRTAVASICIQNVGDEERGDGVGYTRSEGLSIGVACGTL